MHILQLLKGWIYIAIALAALFVLGLALENRHQKARQTLSKDVAQSLSAPEETSTLPSSQSTSSKLEQDGTTGVQETDAKDTKQRSTLPQVEAEKTPTLVPEASGPDTEVVQKPLEPLSQSTESGGLTEKDPGVSDSNELLPESLQFVPLPKESPTLEASTRAVQKQSHAGATNPKDVTPAGEPVTNACPPLAALLYEGGRATEVLENTAMLAWRNAAEQRVSAMVTSTVARIHQSPHHGLTVYLTSENGRHCLVYGHLESLLPGTVPGAVIPCGTPFAIASADDTAPNLVVQAMALLPGQAWWQGTVIEPAVAFPQWLPPESEPDVEDLP